jgi:HEAT repeat protein
MRDRDIEIWLGQCHSRDPVQQVEAIQRLLALDAYTSVPMLIETLKSPDAVVRCTAAGALAHLGQKDCWKAGAALVDLLEDPEVIVRSEAVDALGILGYTPALEEIKALLLNDPEPLVRASAAETLGDFGDASALAELELALHDADDAVRGYAANSIGLLGSTPMLLKLQNFLEQEQSPEVKAEFHGALYRLGSTEDLEALLKLLEVANERLSVNILNTLNDLSSRNAPPTLAADATQIRTAVTALARRTPLLSADAEQIVARLVNLGRASIAASKILL